MKKDRPAGCVDLHAPLSGVVVPIERVPDPVFAQKLVGDGISIDPTSSTLVAPCDGTVIQLHSCGHAITLDVNGVEVLMHIGLDTVTLKGEGFTPLVKVGEHVLRGDSLIEFDADLVATRAKSLLTQIIVTSAERLDDFRAPGGSLVQAGIGKILRIIPGKPSVAAKDSPEGGAFGHRHQ
jgi:phosphocarrier protein FPr